MSAERIALDELLDQSPAAYAKMRACAAALRDGAICIYPTETIYGIGGVVGELSRGLLFAAKQRAPDKPMPWIAPSREVLIRAGCRFGNAARALAERFWPGRVTLIVHGPDEAGVGVRVSGHPFIQTIGAALHAPLYSTSANLSGSSYINDADHIYRLFEHSASFMIDAGALPVSAPSTVVDARDDRAVRIVREGAVAADHILGVVDRTTR
jgi:tRNA threonylcarbamoyl adenosine modification protein (Sua5/YciO/YrdC/YwlC family)